MIYRIKSAFFVFWGSGRENPIELHKNHLGLVLGLAHYSSGVAWLHHIHMSVWSGPIISKGNGHVHQIKTPSSFKVANGFGQKGKRSCKWVNPPQLGLPHHINLKAEKNGLS